MTFPFCNSIVLLFLWLNTLYFSTAIEAVHSQETAAVFRPYTCPMTQKNGKRKAPCEAPPAKRLSIRKGATKTDCWYYIIQKISELPKQGRVLVVTDIDNTLIKKDRHPDGDTFRALPAAVGAINWLLSISELDLIALTARHFQSYNPTITERNLESVNLQMLLPGTEPVLTKEQSEELLRKHKHLHFRNNILYTSHQEKAQALNYFLSVKSSKYSHIVFIDDLIENCEYVLHRLDCDAGKVTVFHFTKPRKSQCLKRHRHEWPPLPLPSPEPGSVDNDSSELQPQSSAPYSTSTFFQMPL